jgi:RND family efflux transporter MFP subunit
MAGLLLLVVLGALLVAGFMPRWRRERGLLEAAAEMKAALPEITVAKARRAPSASDLVLPGNITPITEAQIYARASGYVKRRLVDIGDRVKAGQLLAEIDAPELDQQVRQAQAGVSQAQAALSGAQHALRQAEASLTLARVTAERWRILARKGVVSRQETDQKQADFEVRQAAVEAAQAGVRAARDSVQSAEANAQRLLELQAFKRVVAPFAGVITARNIDVGALIPASGGVPMFRMAQTGVLRIVVDVPQSSAPFIQVGQAAEVTLQEFPGRKFAGRVTRTADALEAGSRTLPTEVQVSNPNGLLLPNMYAQVRLIRVSTTPAVLIPGDTLLIRPDGTQVATVGAGNRIHMQLIEVGRDFGSYVEVRSGLRGGEYVVSNPTDEVREGAEVKPVVVEPEGGPGEPAPGGGRR